MMVASQATWQWPNGCGNAIIKIGTSQTVQARKLYKWTNILNLLRPSPGLLGGRPANVSVVKPGMAIIRKLRVDAVSSQQQAQLARSSSRSPARASKPCQSQGRQQVGLILRTLCRAACSTSASSKVTMPRLGLISTWPLSILSITNYQNHTMGVADAMDTMDTMKHEFLIRCTEEVAQGSLAVKWVFASSMNFTASFLHQVGHTETLLDTHQFERTSIQVILSAWVHGWVLDGAGSANVTLDLHLAVGQLARICLAGEGCGLYKRHQTNQTHCGRLSPASPHLWSEHIILRPVDAVNALGTLSCKFRKRTNHDNCKHMGTHSSWEINEQCPKHVPKQGCVTSCELCDVV